MHLRQNNLPFDPLHSTGLRSPERFDFFYLFPEVIILYLDAVNDLV